MSFRSNEESRRTSIDNASGGGLHSDARQVGSAASRYGRASHANPQSKNAVRSNNASQFARTNPSYSHAAAKKMGRGKKVAIGVAAALLVVLVGVGTAAALYLNSINSALSLDDEQMEALEGVLVPVESADDPFYALLLGSDARGDEASRSDVNILVRVDPSEGTITMISIPRDTKVEIEGYGTQKINAAYAYGGAALAVQTMSEFAGVSISHYAEIHFDELVELIDALGGVEVDVPYDINDSKAGGSISAGLQTLNGEQALIFARSRAYADGDFTRTSNQRLLLEAVIDKVLSVSVTELPGTIQSLAQCVSTDYNVSDVISLALKLQGADKLTIYSDMVPSSTATIDGVSYVITDEEAWAEMMQAVDAGEDPSATDDDSSASDEG